MVTPIKSVEYLDGLDLEGTVGMVLDAPDSDVRELCLGLCQEGGLLAIQARGKK